jgi:hypothetical protein
VAGWRAGGVAGTSDDAAGELAPDAESCSGDDEPDIGAARASGSQLWRQEG